MNDLTAVDDLDDGRDPHDVAIGLRIKEARRRKSMGQQELADLVHVTLKAVGNWENGRSRPRPENFASLARVLEVTEDWLWRGDSFEVEMKQLQVEMRRVLLQSLECQRKLLDEVRLLRLDVQEKSV